MSFFDDFFGDFFEFPHTRTYDTDLGWLIHCVEILYYKVEEYTKENFITYADPIQWNITSQYGKNTIVLDSNGTAYMSLQAVPAGIPLTNSSYWMPVFNFDEQINKLREAIANNVESGTTAGADRNPGDLVFVGGVLYEVQTFIPAGSAYTIGSNITTINIEELLEKLRTAVDTQISDLETVVNNNRTETDAEIQNVRTETAEQIQNLTDNLDVYIRANGVGSIYCDNKFILEMSTRTHNNFWGATVLGEYLYQYCADGTADGGTGKILKININTGAIVKTVNQDLYWGNALTNDGTYIYGLYGDNTQTMRIYKLDTDLNYIGVVTLSMSYYSESLTYDGEQLRIIAVNRAAHIVYVRKVSLDLNTVSTEEQYTYPVDADIHNSLIFYNNGYMGITITAPQRMIFMDDEFNLLRAIPFDGRAFNNAVSIGEVEGMTYDPDLDLFYINGQLSQTAAAFQDTTALILHTAKIGTAPGGFKGLGDTYFTLQNFEVYVNIDTGSIFGDGSGENPFKSPIAANNAIQYYSSLGWRCVLNFTAGQDLSDYILALNGLDNVQVYTRGLTLLGLYMYRCNNVEFNAPLVLFGERIVGTGYRGAQLDLNTCFGCIFSGGATLTTGEQAQYSLRVQNSYNNLFNSLTMNKGYQDNTGEGFLIKSGNIPEKLSTYELHNIPNTTYTADNITGIVQQIVATVLGKTGTWVHPVSWAGHWSGIVIFTGNTAARYSGIITAQLGNTGNKMYAFTYDAGNIRIVSFTGTVET